MSNINIEDERKIAGKAKAVLSSLVPSSPRSQTKLSVIGRAFLVATNKASDHLHSREEALNIARRNAAAALNGIYELLGKGRVPQGMIDQARDDVDAWLKALTDRV